MKLSIVVACERALPDPGVTPQWLVAARAAAAAVGLEGHAAHTAELLLIGEAPRSGDASLNPRPGDVRALDSLDERWITVPAGTLVPVRWARGMIEAAGDVVGITIDRCTLPSSWGVAAIDAIERGYAGAGGGFTLRPDSSALDRAIYHLRYGAFPPGRVTLERAKGEIAGDNAVYCMNALQPSRDEWRDGFWEVIIHRQIRSAGGVLAHASGMDVAFGDNHGVGQFIRQRFEHGSHFGEWRLTHGQVPSWRLVLAAPLVPLVFALRAWRRAPSMSEGRRGLLSGLPHFLALSTAWAAGEAWAVVARPRP